jgi:hypothetical protein
MGDHAVGQRQLVAGIIESILHEESFQGSVRYL